MPAPAKSREAPDGSDPRMVGRRPSLARRRHAAGAAPDHARGRGRPALHRAGYVRELLGRDPAGGGGQNGRPREMSVEVNLGKVPLDKLVKLISDIERSPGVVRVRRLRVRKAYENKELLDVSLTVSAWQGS